MSQIASKTITHSNVITIPKKMVGGDDLVIVQKKAINEITQENIELKAAFKAVFLGEQALRQGKTRSFNDFLKSKFPEYAKNY